LEQAWSLSRSLEEREEVDERIFSALRARAGEGEAGAPDQEEGEVWKELWAFYEQVKKKAPDDAAPMLRYRAAWWAVRIGDRDEAYRILPLLHDPENPVLAYEELLLDLAERTENQALVVRQLELIAEIDPRREEEALIRKAEMRLKLNFEDEAIRMLQSVANRPGASLKAVQALARAYLQQGRNRALEELWSKAFATANLLERREILEPYTETLTRLAKIPEALDIYAAMIPGRAIFCNAASFSTISWRWRPGITSWRPGCGRVTRNWPRRIRSTRFIRRRSPGFFRRRASIRKRSPR